MAVASMHLGTPELQTECQNGKERGFKQQHWQKSSTALGFQAHRQLTLR